MNHLKKLNANLVDVFGFGWFIIGYLGQMVLWLLTSLYSIIPNYGVVCILFAFIVRVFTGPLTEQSFLSNHKLQTFRDFVLENDWNIETKTFKRRTTKLSYLEVCFLNICSSCTLLPM